MTDAPAPPRPVLLLSGGPVTEPIWPLLAETYDLAFLYPQAAQQAQAQGLPAAAIGSVMDGAAQESAANDALKLTARVVNALPQISGRFGAEYGPSSPSALTAGVENWFGGYAHQMITLQVGILAGLDKLAQTDRRIAGCVTHEDVSADTRAMVNWCNARSIPTIHVPHAPCHLLPGVRDIHGQTRAQWIAASGQAVAEFYTARGHDPARIVITGGPQYDVMYGPRPDKAEARRVLGIANDDSENTAPVMLYFTTWGQTTSLRGGFEHEFTAGWQAVLAEAKRRGAYLCVKIHWHDNRAGVEERYEKDLAAAGVPGLVTRSHLLYVLAAADVLVAQGPSNICLEAAMAGVPSCYLVTDGFDFATPLPYRGCPETIGDAIGQALGEPADWDGFVAAYNAVHPHGGAAENVVEMVRRVCR